MKTILILLLGLCVGASTYAQAPVVPPTAPLLTADQLDQLLGPIALYPDSLIALILPASTVPSDVVLAERYQSAKGDPAQIPNQSWSDSVKSLTRYPTVLQWLNQNLDWTTQLGTAFISQPAGVMDAIQQLRARAKAAGHLVSTTQQQVLVDSGDICIQPANPQVIYVPQYDSDTIYDEGGYADMVPFMTFGMGYAMGAWLNYDMDWHRHGVYMGDWRTGRDYRGYGGAAGNYANITNARQWRPSANSVQHALRTGNQGIRAVSHAQPLPGVTIPHGTRTAGNKQAGTLATRVPSGGNSSNPQVRDFTGRSPSGPSVATLQHQTTTPAVAAHAPTTPNASILNDYRRGSDARQSSNRGQLSRQPSVAPAIYRPASPSLTRAEPTHSAPAAVRSAPAASAYHMSAAPAAHAASAQGGQSRGRR